ncbi:MAG: hypothetical protein D6798_19755 [Deltaproteobacteria bacterium]|nr:MAG: hypothetical protein D6798_19755 [Deltaproteobacteria bacterium]
MQVALLLAIAMPSARAAGTYSSEPQHVVLSDEANVFEEAEIDSGWLPTDSPLQARFQIAGLGATGVLMEGDAELTWPENLNLHFQPEPGSGEMVVDASLAAITSVRFDIFGYSWESEIDRRSIDIAGETIFNPFVLVDQAPSRVEVIDDGDAIELITYSLEVFAGVGLTFDATLNTRMEAGFEGLGWVVDEVEYPYSTDVVNFPAEGQSSQDVVAHFLGGWDGSFSLVIEPSLSVDAGILGSYEVLRFEIPIPLATSSFEQLFPQTDLSFPLPVLRTDIDSYDFGELEVGQLANLELAIHNDGLLDLEGVPALTGSPYFSMYPEYFQAGPGREDGIVVSFAPEAAGEFDATLLLASNDPARPAMEIALHGVAVEPDVEVDTGTSSDTGTGDGAGGAVIQSEVQGCGCASSGGSSRTFLGVLLGVVLVAAGRRRRAQ